MMREPSRKSALVAGASFMALGVPMRREPNQRFTDMYKPGWDLATIEAYQYGDAVPVPNARCLK